MHKQCLRWSSHLILEGIHAQPLIALEQSGLLEEFGEDNVVGELDEALTRAVTFLKSSEL